MRDPNKKYCKKCGRENETNHHKYCQDCWEKENIKKSTKNIEEWSKRKAINERDELKKLANSINELLEPFKERMKIIEKTGEVKRSKVFEHMMDSGDYFRVYLLDKPRLNDVDDIEVEMNGVYGTTAFGIQDWEALTLTEGLFKAIVKKYGSLGNMLVKLKESGKLLGVPELFTDEKLFGVKESEDLKCKENAPNQSQQIQTSMEGKRPISKRASMERTSEIGDASLIGEDKTVDCNIHTEIEDAYFGETKKKRRGLGKKTKEVMENLDKKEKTL